MNVQMMTFDSETEILKVKQFFPTAKMVLRFYCEGKCMWNLGKKFGATFDECKLLIKLAKEHKINLVGVSFHVGSLCQSPETFAEAIKTARDIFNIASESGFTLKVLDIGGGYLPNVGTLISEFGKVINNALDEYFPISCNVDIIAEPGRYLVDTSPLLAARIVGYKQIDMEDKTSFMYYINDGIYGSFMAIYMGEEQIPPKSVQPKEGGLYKSTVWGPTCDGIDVVCKDVLLPKMEINEWIYFPSVGSYRLTLITNFNGYSPPKIITVVSESAWSTLEKTGNSYQLFTYP